MAFVDRVLTATDFAVAPWNDAIRDLQDKDCLALHHAFQAEATRRRGSAGAAADAFQFLAVACSMTLRPDNRKAPFDSLVKMTSGARSAIPSDLSESELDLLFELYPLAVDPSLRARLADLCWSMRRSPDAGREAVAAYIASARKSTRWPSALDQIKRAFVIASALGRETEPFRSLVPELVAWAHEAWKVEGPKHLAAGLTEVVVASAEPEAKAFGDQSLAEGRLLRQEGKTFLERRFLHLAADLYGIAKVGADRESVLREIADSYLEEGRTASAAGNVLVAPAHFEAAIAMLRRLPGGERERVESIRQELAPIQRSASAAMKRISTSTDISGIVHKAREAVTDKPLLDALSSLAVSWNPPETDRLRAEIEEISQRAPLQSLIARVFVDSSGRKLGVRDPLVPGSDKYEEALWIEMVQHAAYYRQLQVVGVIEPMREVIIRQHSLTEASLAPILDSNPFVPGDRKLLFAKGLTVGFEGDWPTAIHLLLPQLENSLRKLLADAGELTSSFSSDGSEEVFGLDRLLSHPTIVKILGDDQVFDLRSLLIEGTGPNLRHTVAHGLRGDADFFTTDCIYLWWLVLRFCLMPVLYRQGGALVPGGGSVPQDQEAK